MNKLMAGSMLSQECGNSKQVSMCDTIGRLNVANGHADENHARLMQILERLRGSGPCDPEKDQCKQDGHIYSLDYLVLDYHEINRKITVAIEELERLVG